MLGHSSGADSRNECPGPWTDPSVLTGHRLGSGLDPNGLGVKWWDDERT